ncbi:MAG: ribonuclease HII [Gammaproteobacteria bacterium]|nr:ribonuclease HII [Gammaproteobacteria bacterium]
MAATVVITEQQYSSILAGVDEAGRGPLAGPVVAAAVILDPQAPISGLNDSKKLTEQQRNRFAPLIKQHALCYAIAHACVTEIDALNILQATLLAMQRAINGLSVAPDLILVDGNRLPKTTIPAEAIVKGDSLIPAISAASILAKVTRDALMLDYHRQYPNYAFHRHKGYGTKQHLAEINRFGCLEIHRRSFQPIKTLLAR